MKFGAATLVVVVALAGCSREGVPPTPTAPTSPVAVAPAPPAPPPATTGSALLWVMVFPAGGSGACLEGATIQIMGAQGAGEPIPQEPCDYWGYYGGLLLKDLTPGVEVTLRGAAPGYTPREKSFLPFPTPGSYQAVFIELSKAQ